MRLQTKLIIGFLIVALLIAGASYISINISQNTLQKSIGKNSVTLAQETLDKIDRTIYYRIEEWQAYSHDLILQKTIKKSNEEFEDLSNIQDYIDTKDEEWISVPKETITSFMQELINNELSQELSEKIEFYEEKNGYRVFGEIFMTNKYGANIAQTGKTSDYYQADEEWWQVAKEDGLYIKDVQYDKSADIYSTDIGIRINDKNGNFLGVMKVVLNIEEAINILKVLELKEIPREYKTIEFKLVNKECQIVYSTEEFELFEFSDLCQQFENKTVHINYFIAAGDKTGEEKELFAQAHSKGYKDYRGLGWILIIEHKTEEIFKPVVQLRNILLIISIIITVIAILIGLLLSQIITRPIKRLTQSAKRIKRGNLDTPCEIKSNDEIGELAETFDEMRLGLKDRNDLLNSLLKTFKGKFGNIAVILTRKNVQELVEKNPRIKKILPKLFSTIIKRSEKDLKKKRKK